MEGLGGDKSHGYNAGQKRKRKRGALGCRKNVNVVIGYFTNR
jgi:hypothetical protein